MLRLGAARLAARSEVGTALRGTAPSYGTRARVADPPVSTGGAGGAEPVVVFDRVTKSFRDGVTAIEDVSFSARPGRILGILGRNGAGKSTALRVLLGLAAPTAGSATILGQPYGTLEDARLRVGVSMDEIGFLRGSTVQRELRIWATALELSEARVAAVVEEVGLEGAAGRRTDKLSTGMKQRLALGIALLADPDVLVLDEPANGLDPPGIRWLRDLLRVRAGAGKTVILSSHLLAEVEQTVDDVVILQQRVRFAGTLEELTRGTRGVLEERFMELVEASG